MAATPANKPKPTIVIKRIKKVAGGHHGGAWKIAYADFVTAMMAFFLLMWLLGSTTQGDLKGIADFFQNPMRVSMSGGSGAGDALSLISGGGGRDLTAASGQLRRGQNDEKNVKAEAAKQLLEQQERLRLEQLKSKLVEALNANLKLSEFMHQIKVDITPEGLRIQIVDDQKRPMFDTGKAVMKSYMGEILRAIAPVLNEVDHKITLLGHTDATPFSGGNAGYSNWELSADRANASRRELVIGGIDESKIVRVAGLASSVPLLTDDVNHPANRRISIIVMNKRAEDQMFNRNTETVPPSPVVELPAKRPGEMSALELINEAARLAEQPPAEAAKSTKEATE